MAGGRGAVVRGLLRDTGFRRLYASRLLSQAADGVFQASLASAVLFSPERKTDAASVAAGFSVLLLPYSLVGPFAGVLLDRWSRVRILVRATLVRALLVVVSAAVLVTVDPVSIAFYLVALAVISVNRFFLATLSAGLPRLVGTADLATANSLSVTSGTFATVLGAGLGVVLRGSGTDRAAAVVALVAAVGYLSAAAVARGFDVHRLGPPEGGAGRLPLTRQFRMVAAGLLAGVRHVQRRPTATRALAAMTAHRFLFGVMTLVFLLTYRNSFTDDGLALAGLAGLTQLVVLSGLGTLIGALVTPAAVRRVSKQAWLTAMLVLGAAGELAFGLPYTPVAFLAAGLVLGVVSQGSKIAVDTLVQETIDDDFRGRVFSVYDTLFNLSYVAAAAAAAVILPAGGVSRPTVLALAGGYALTAVAYALTSHRELSRPTA